jgi:hypothetical protein
MPKTISQQTKEDIVSLYLLKHDSLETLATLYDVASITIGRLLRDAGVYEPKPRIRKDTDKPTGLFTKSFTPDIDLVSTNERSMVIRRHENIPDEDTLFEGKNHRQKAIEFINETS